MATTALSFILESSEAARNGMLKLLRGIVPDLPRLWFRTQQSDENTRPDMWGTDEEGKPHVFVENKFWAGLTENQPVSYLGKLANHTHPTVLLFVVPHSREQAVWREVTRRLERAGISATNRESPAGIVSNAKTRKGPIIAITSWSKLLTFMEEEVTDDAAARSNLLQLRALCDQADEDAFIPFTGEEISDQRTPALILQLTSVVQEATALAFDERVLFRDRLLPQADATRIGRYASILDQGRCGLWFGLHFGLWKKHGGTPLWGLFSGSNWGRSPEVRALLEPWAFRNRVVLATEEDNHLAVAIDFPLGQEKAVVVREIVNRIKEIAGVLSGLKVVKKKGVPGQ